MTEELGRTWRQVFDYTVVKGATAFRAEHDSSEDGVFYFSYKPPATSVGGIVGELKEQLLERDRCLRVISETATEVQVRCSELRGTVPPRAQEVRVLVNPKAGRVFVMCMDRIPKDATLYGEYIHMFRRISERQ